MSKEKQIEEMARYIDLAMVEYLIDHFGGMVTWNKKEILREIKRHAQIHATADVVPKSEVDKWKQKAEELSEVLSDTIRIRYSEAKVEVAREIFEEIDGITDLFAKGLIGELEMYDKLAELKKKYTESEVTE